MKFQNKPTVAYVPHGIDSKAFYPIEFQPGEQQYEQMQKIRSTIFKNKNNQIDFVVFFNSRNIRRKMIPDLILAYKTFCSVIGRESADRCALLLHTQPIDENGTDLLNVIENICPDENIFFSPGLVDTATLNILYNIADVTACIGSNEGWGLSFTESVMAGTPVIGNVTGGMQDQMRFEDEDGNWINFTSEIPSNHTGIYKKHGLWVTPVYPASRSIQGSIPTPYIFDDRIAFEDVAVAIKKWYDTKHDFRETAGQLGREWMMSDEARMTASHLGSGMIKCIDHVLDNWTPKKNFEIIDTKNQKYRPDNSGVLVDFTKLV